MKRLNLLITLLIFVVLSCKDQTLSESERSIVESEIHQFIDSVDSAFESVSPENIMNYMIKSDELAIASQGKLMTDASAILDTIRVHVKDMQKQEINTVAEKIYIINQNNAVVSTSKTAEITLKNGNKTNIQYALTMLMVKKDGEWKIAHYHN